MIVAPGTRVKGWDEEWTVVRQDKDGRLFLRHEPRVRKGRREKRLRPRQVRGRHVDWMFSKGILEKVGKEV